MKKVVIPGEILFEERKRLGSNVFVLNGKIYSKVLGITDNENETATVVPLQGPYVPRRDDSVVGVITRENFDSEDFKEIVTKIITHGDVQLTTDQRRAFLERKRSEIINIISQNAINPQTKTPHPPQRIENAMEQEKIHIDAFKSTEEQVESIVNAIKKILPISMEKIDFAVKIPAAHAGRCSAIIHKFEIKKEQWLNDGSLAAEFKLPVGLKQDLLNELNSATHGDLIVKIVE